jgi:Ca2+-binding RTX toxin-like protein
MEGGSGVDILNYAESSAAVSVILNAGVGVGGDAQGDTNIGFENVTGSNFNDVLTGDVVANVLQGGNGNDVLMGGGGNDTLIGGSGSDTLTGGTGLDGFRFLNISERADTITDFNGDRLQIKGSSFGGGLTLGLLDTAKLVLGASATASTHRFVYNNGALYFDIDGTGSASQVLIVNITNNGGVASMNANNIQII